MALGIGTLLLIAAGAASTAGGVVQGGKGINKIFKSNKRNKELQSKVEKFSSKLTLASRTTVLQMDRLGRLEMEILSTFSTFSELVEKISNKPDFDEIILEEFKIPKFNNETLESISTGAAALLAGATGGVSGVLAGFAAAGAVKSTIVAVGTASTGTALSSLSGAALTKATLAAIGGGSIAAGGGGIALGSAILGISTAGIGILIGGTVFNSIGNQVEEKVEKLENEVKEIEQKYNELENYLYFLKKTAHSYYISLNEVKDVYEKHLNILERIIHIDEKSDWNDFDNEEKVALENLVLLVGLLYSMCQVNLVKVSEVEGEINSVNSSEAYEIKIQAKQLLAKIDSE